MVMADTIATGDKTSQFDGKHMQDLERIYSTRDTLDDNFFGERGQKDANGDYYDELNNEETNYSGSSYYGHSDDSEVVGLIKNDTVSQLPPLDSFIFPDSRALFLLDLGNYADLTYEEIIVHGFEIYIVEQWVACRNLSTLITSYTGNSQDTISGVRVVLPKDTSMWPGRFRQYFEEVMEFARPKFTPKGTLFITNLSGVSFGLNLLHVECGDLRTIWKDFEVNFDLKNLHCGGRSANLLCPPTMASLDKFSQLFKIPTNGFIAQYPQMIQQQQPRLPEEEYKTVGNSKCRNTDSKSPVVEMVTLIQISLSYFNLLSKNYQTDGLLCEDTKRAIDEWWETYGKLYLGTEKPRNECTLGPTTVAGLISLILCCYFKLMIENCISSKDPFDEAGFFQGIYNFQKKHGLNKRKSRVYLDPRTLEKLFEVTAKVSSKDIFKLKKMVTSTVQDIIGKGNPINLSHKILTTDLDTLIHNIHGGSVGLLWKGKGHPRKCCTDISNEEFLKFNYQRGDPDGQIREREMLLEKFRLERIAYAQKHASKKVSSSSLDTSEDIGRTNAMPSSATVSSMFPNYDNTKYAYNFGINKLYQGEYYRRNSFPYCKDRTHDNIYEDLSELKEKSSRLYRCNSSSAVQNIVEKWDLPFDPSVVRIARDLLRMKYDIQAQQHIQEMDEHYMGKLNKEGTVGQYSKFNERYKRLQELYKKYSDGAKVFEGRFEDIDNKQQLLLHEMQELHSLSSRLKYDMRILEVRVRDIESSVAQFDSKLIGLKSSLQGQGKTGICSAIDPKSDKDEYDRCVNDLMTTNNPTYEALCLKMLSRRYFKDLKNDTVGWFRWLFGNNSLHNNASEDDRGIRV
ncbi:BFH_HP2_G0040410.mRNA.1.CDS.1 [Saccharomyces cerevisiae]|nr:BFH_HP2_G0040410.mRNA.1.CDS.1 [Saccharomyces cerevisiae]CAI6689782.1 BFH_HP2_G0040410.mRNA.1.CDS.1 [Saccharomyces cerevisiae]CAI6702592.1 BFH_HP1_G0040820.mRNA.1.CDS.1 [Saccharomyces cerevisiae]